MKQYTVDIPMDEIKTALANHDLRLHSSSQPVRFAQSNELASAVRRGEPGALTKFVEYHIPWARRQTGILLRSTQMDVEDAQQTAMIGLLEAARRFDPERGEQFLGYATHWIRQDCQRYGLLWGLPIRIPPNVFWVCHRLLFMEERLMTICSPADVRKHLLRELTAADVSWKQWQAFCRTRRVNYFSDIPASRRTWLDRPDDSWGIDEKETLAALRHELQRGLKALKPIHERILRLRYGIGRRQHTLQKIADQLGLTRERVRQIQVLAEKRLAFFLSHHGYDGLRPAAPSKTEEHSGRVEQA